MDKLLETADLKKYYSSQNEVLKILTGINFSILQNERISITGESGSGKSTFLNLIGGLDNVTSGSIKVQGLEITELDEYEITYFRNKKIGFIFQDHYLLDEFTALENVMMPSLINDFNFRKAKAKAEKLLSYMRMDERMKHFPRQLSGGEKQRVAIARSFMNDPLLILADEPTGNLDEKNAFNVLELLFNITTKENHSLIIVSHSNIVKKMASRNYKLENGILHEEF
jgi:lipoprotein-releasing system ATP-binding protein